MIDLATSLVLVETVAPIILYDLMVIRMFSAEQLVLVNGFLLAPWLACGPLNPDSRCVVLHDVMRWVDAYFSIVLSVQMQLL